MRPRADLLERAPSLGHIARMAKCGHCAVLIITTNPTGTTTSLVRRRVELCCGLDADHEGEHRDLVHGEAWQGTEECRSTVLRQADDET